MLHTWYWRSPHFTREYRYYFEIEANQQLETQLLVENDLVEIGKVTLQGIPVLHGNIPEWFVAKTLENYAIYRYREAEGSNFWVFIDKETQNIYLTDSQY